VDDRADALGILQSDKTTLVLIECTREKPTEKFSTLAERANHLRKSLPIRAEVLPVVFTAARSLNPFIDTLRESRYDTVVDSALSMARQFANRS
jgi:hypothetical protein